MKNPSRLAACLFLLAAPSPVSVAHQMAPEKNHARPILIQGVKGIEAKLLETRLEAAAVTAAFIRSSNATVVVGNMANGCFEAKAAACSGPKAAGGADRQTADDIRLMSSQIKQVIDASLEAYARIVGEIASDSSDRTIEEAIKALDREMGFRGQAPLRRYLPVMAVHIRSIQTGSPPSLDDVKSDILAVANRR